MVVKKQKQITNKQNYIGGDEETSGSHGSRRRKRKKENSNETLLIWEEVLTVLYNLVRTTLITIEMY